MKTFAKFALYTAFVVGMAMGITNRAYTKGFNNSQNILLQHMVVMSEADRSCCLSLIIVNELENKMLCPLCLSARGFVA